jgi:phosphotriesterase-related protein
MKYLIKARVMTDTGIDFRDQSYKTPSELSETESARRVEPGSIPDFTGNVLTVLGPIPPNQLGATLMHEHLFIDLRRTHLPYPIQVQMDGHSEPVLTSEDFPATELMLYESKVNLGNLHTARDGGLIADNYILADEALAAKEILEFKKRGGNTVVDVTSIGIKRDPEALRRVSKATGLNIIMGTGYYQRVYHPEYMDDLSIENLTDTIVADVVLGVGNTGIRSGLIGEVGVNGDPLRPNEIKSILASARASRLTGAAISFHRGGAGSERHKTLNLVGEEGVNSNRVILGHSEEIVTDLDLMLELLERGVYIQFDLLGRETSLTASPTSQVAKAIPHLIEAGFEDRILLSHDVCWKVHLQHYGGFGYSFLLEKFLPYLHENGVTKSQTEKFMVENPARILPFQSPQHS